MLSPIKIGGFCFWNTTGCLEKFFCRCPCVRSAVTGMWSGVRHYSAGFINLDKYMNGVSAIATAALNKYVVR